MHTTIPASIDDVDAACVAEATGWVVDDLRAEEIGVGVGVASSIYRLHLKGAGCPPSVVAKMPSLDAAAAYTGRMLRMYQREVGFYQRLAMQVPIRVPAPRFAAVDDEAHRFLILMEDLGQLRAVDQVAGMSIDDAKRAVDALSCWHAKWWGRAEGFVADRTTMTLADPIFPAILPTLFAEGWEKCLTQLGLPDAIVPIGPKFGPAVASLLSSLARGPNTLLHGDYRADNILFDADGALALLDFQFLATGSAAYDLAYFVTQSLGTDDASRHERALFARWIDGLRSNVTGGDPIDEGALWDDYRRAALFCLVYPIVASRGVDFADVRARAMLQSMITRIDRAVRELDLAALLPQ